MDLMCNNLSLFLSTTSADICLPTDMSTLPWLLAEPPSKQIIESRPLQNYLRPKIKLAMNLAAIPINTSLLCYAHASWLHGSAYIQCTIISTVCTSSCESVILNSIKESLSTNDSQSLQIVNTCICDLIYAMQKLMLAYNSIWLVKNTSHKLFSWSRVKI